MPEASSVELWRGVPYESAQRAVHHRMWRENRLDKLLHEGTKPRNRGQTHALEMVKSARARGNMRAVLAIGRRWGKSYFCCVWALTLALSRAGSRIPYAASTVVSLNEYIVPIMSAIISTAPDDMRPEIVGHEVRCKNGSRIVMQGCEDRVKANRLRGPAAHGAVVDEAAFISCLEYVVGDVLMYQLATTDGMMIVASSPPESPAHPFAAMAADAEQRGAYMHATIHDAPHMAPAMIAKLCEESGGETAAGWRREALAEFIVDPTLALIPEFSEHEAFVVEERERAPFTDRYVVGDLGYVDLSFFVFATTDFKAGVVYVEDELVLERTTSDVIQHSVADKERALWGASRVYRRVVDAPAITRADMTRLQPQDDPTRANAWQPARTDDPEAAVNQLRLAVQRHKLRIHPRCVALISHLRHGVWNARRTSFERSAGLGHFDGVAAAMYLERHADRNRNPYPPPAWDESRQVVHPAARLPSDEQARRALQWSRAFTPTRKT